MIEGSIDKHSYKLNYKKTPAQQQIVKTPHQQQNINLSIPKTSHNAPFRQNVLVVKQIRANMQQPAIQPAEGNK
jgi:hypothetical protein